MLDSFNDTFREGLDNKLAETFPNINFQTNIAENSIEIVIDESMHIGPVPNGIKKIDPYDLPDKVLRFLLLAYFPNANIAQPPSVMPLLTHSRDTPQINSDNIKYGQDIVEGTKIRSMRNMRIGIHRINPEVIEIVLGSEVILNSPEVADKRVSRILYVNNGQIEKAQRIIEVLDPQEKERLISIKRRNRKYTVGRQSHTDAMGGSSGHSVRNASIVRIILDRADHFRMTRQDQDEP